MAQMISWIDRFPNAETGEGLYHQFCANCHGLTGVPGRFAAEFGEEPIAVVTRGGKEDSVANPRYMPGWSTSEMSDAELQLIEAFVSSF